MPAILAKPVAFGCSVLLLFGATRSIADPVADTCRFLAVVGGNEADQIAPLMTDLGARWVDKSRNGAIETLGKLLGQLTFAGGSAYRIGKLGDDVEEHLVILRLKEGEVAGVRLVYQWVPDGMGLTAMDFKRQFAEITQGQFLQPPEPLDCK